MKQIKMRSCSLLLNKSQLIVSRIIVKSFFSQTNTIRRSLCAGAGGRCIGNSAQTDKNTAKTQLPTQMLLPCLSPVSPANLHTGERCFGTNSHTSSHTTQPCLLQVPFSHLTQIPSHLYISPDTDSSSLFSKLFVQKGFTPANPLLQSSTMLRCFLSHPEKIPVAVFLLFAWSTAEPSSTCLP